MATATRTKHSKLDHVSMTPGLTVIHPNPDQARKSSSDDPTVDIIAVPGLGANPQFTWKHAPSHNRKGKNHDLCLQKSAVWEGVHRPKAFQCR